MARLPYLDRADLPPEQQDLLDRNINLYRMLTHSPGAARAFSGLGTFIRHHSKLNPRLRELAILQVGWLARAPYEWSHHIKIGYDFGVTDEDIQALIADTPLDPPAQMALLAAREMTTDMTISDSTFAALRTHLDEECLLDLVMTISFYNGVVRLLAALQIDVEDDYRPYLDKYPLPD
jgi:alkylhydroperoxidase family enzyme